MTKFADRLHFSATVTWERKKLIALESNTSILWFSGIQKLAALTTFL